MSPQTGKWCMKDASIGALGDSFYEYLLKLWLYKNNSDKQLLDTYLAAMDAVKERLLGVSAHNKYAYFGDFKAGNRLEKKMDHLACFTGGLLGLTAKYVDTLSEKQREEYLELGKNITNTCHESYIKTPTRIGPEAFHFERADQEAKSIKANEKYYILRPEVIEAYFYMWRFTKDQKYRDWAWDAAQAIEASCRTDAGFSGIKDVYDPNSPKDDVQQSFFFAETLKYLFLIFSDDDVLPLDKFVFNTEAHPFRIRN
jgi:mannosyl-oligosaccharide alpha-1,2-mannosidase